FYLAGYAELTGILVNRMSAHTDWRYLTGVSIAFTLMAAGVRFLMDTVVGSVRRALGEEERFAKMIQATPAATTVTRYEDGTFLEANRAALELFGRTREEMIGRTTLSLGAWPNPEDRANLMRSMRDGGSVHLRPVTIRRPSGELRDILVSAAWVEIEQQKQMLMSAVDITDVHRTEELLR